MLKSFLYELVEMHMEIYIFWLPNAASICFILILILIVLLYITSKTRSRKVLFEGSMVGVCVVNGKYTSVEHWGNQNPLHLNAKIVQV